MTYNRKIFLRRYSSLRSIPRFLAIGLSVCCALSAYTAYAIDAQPCPSQAIAQMSDLCSRWREKAEKDLSAFDAYVTRQEKVMEANLVQNLQAVLEKDAEVDTEGANLVMRLMV